jgi:hypothetical protein
VGLLKRRARMLYRQKVRRPARVFLRGLLEQWCADCQKHVQPFHPCSPRSDFKRRRGQQERAETRRRQRKPATAKGTAKPAARRRPRGNRAADHYKTCRDADCQRQLCIVFREGKASCDVPHV